MRIKEIITTAVLIILLSGSSSEQFSGLTADIFSNLLNSDSYIPPEEAYIHIAGGFFSVFDRKSGYIFQLGNQCYDRFPGKVDAFQNKKSNYGCIKLKLERLEYTSQFIYRPKGKIILEIPGQEDKCFSMEKLDYINVQGYSAPCYRLSGILSNCEASEDMIKAKLICYAENITAPVLYGNLYLTDYMDSTVCYPIKIYGRRENAADKHLHKVILRLSHFS